MSYLDQNYTKYFEKDLFGGVKEYYTTEDSSLNNFEWDKGRGGVINLGGSANNDGFILVKDEIGNDSILIDNKGITVKGRGSLEFEGEATVWNDYMIPGTSVKTGATAPDFDATIANDASMLCYSFAGSGVTIEQVYFTVQIPHDYKEGSTIFPHVHFSPTSTNSGDTASRVVRFSLEYTWSNVNGTFGTSAIVNMDSDGFVPNTSQWKHLICKSSTGISGTGKTLSSMMVCRLYRDPGDSIDTYPQDAAFLQFDIHYETNTVGSELEYTKKVYQ